MGTQYKVDTDSLQVQIEALTSLLGEFPKEVFSQLASASDSGNTHDQINATYSTLQKTQVQLTALIEYTRDFFQTYLNAVLGNDSTAMVTPTGGIIRTGLNVDLAGQHTNYTCGSASGSMILRYLGIDVSEEEFWRFANAGGYGTYVYRIAQTINHFAGGDVYKYVNTSNYSLEEYYQRLSGSIQAGYPVEVVARIPGGTDFGYSTGGHYFVVTGVYKNANGEYMAKINDPFSGGWSKNGHQGQQLEMKLSDIQKYNANHSGYIICH